MSEQRKAIGIVWEGEWPAVKEVVRTSRKATQFTYGFLHDALYFPGASRAMNSGLQRVDDGVHHSSVFVAQYLNQTSPWLPSASAVVATALFAGVKSHHYWGPVAAARNGFVAFAASGLFFFPDEIRAAVFPAEGETGISAQIAAAKQSAAASSESAAKTTTNAAEGK